MCGADELLASSVVAADWLTPACAGRTLIQVDRCFGCRAHPRVCGADAVPEMIGTYEYGSPQRVRGGRAGADNQMLNERLTPGVCGADSLQLLHAVSRSGSPPRVRGGLARTTSRIPQRGLTPACAGRTVIGPRKMRACAAHPRVCGADIMADHLLAPDGGSPPRVRGGPRW